MGGEYTVGVDGGASRTRGILVDAGGEIVASEEAGGSNPNAGGTDRAAAVCDRLVAKLSARARARGGRVVRTLLCMAGDRAFWRSYGRGLRRAGPVQVVDDARPILELAAGEKPAIVLHAGTGSFVVARDVGGAISYHGGLGWRYGDEGSGYDIGRRAVAVALLEAQDSWRDHSEVAKLVRRHVRARTNAQLERAYHAEAASPPFVARLGSGVLTLAERGDPGARGIVLGSTSALLARATQVAAGLFPERSALGLGLSGPILTHPFVAPALQSLSAFPLYRVQGQPIEGVRRLLARTPPGRT